MLLFTILLATFIVLIMFTVIAIAVGGSAFIIVFGDVIVCIFILAWIGKYLFKKK